ncbi:RNA-binding protein 1-like [Abeliophyllum distichum]|uniref:RNA-binding protein 1-like n=1 Tax=Abeliophyllum distichum TaxID=126358 RepID=A0ABD1Q8Q5_9LAMI
MGNVWKKNFKTEQSSHTGTGKPSCLKCGKKHEGRCLKRNRICYRCGNKGHFVKDCTHNQLEKVEKSKENVGVFALPHQGAEEDTRCKKCGKRREGECLKVTCYRCGNERYFVKDRTQNHKVENQSKGNVGVFALAQQRAEEDLDTCCKKCAKKHEGECLKGKRKCYRCGNKGHFIKDCTHNQQEKVENQSMGNVGVFALTQGAVDEPSVLAELWLISCTASGSIPKPSFPGYLSSELPTLTNHNPSRSNDLWSSSSDFRQKDILPSRPGAYGIKILLVYVLNPVPLEATHLLLRIPIYEAINVMLLQPLVLSGDKAMVLCFVEFTDAKCALTAREALQDYKFDDKKPDSPVLSIHFAHFPFRLPSDRDEQ